MAEPADNTRREGGPRGAVPRRIVGFEQDEAGQWVARLECGHRQHVRHNPPWQNRPWTRSEAGRRARIGAFLRCRECGEEGNAGKQER